MEKEKNAEFLSQVLDSHQCRTALGTLFQLSVY